MEPRPFAFHKMEALLKLMQDPESGIPVRSQKIFLTCIPSAFMGYDLIEWLMEHLNIEESGEAVHLANQLCQYGYLFPVADCKNLTVKDDNSLYRFQAAYYWPWHHRNPDNVEYAIYLVKRTLRNKQRHALEDYEVEALASLKKNLQNKWEIITMQAEEQVKVGKERKKMEKLVTDSQERAYWRVHRPPPGCQPPLEPAPISSLRRQISPPQHNTQLEILRRQLSRSRIKVSQAVESLVTYSNTYSEYDPMMSTPQPSNPWLSDDPAFWQFNQPIVEVPTEKRVKRWGLSFEDLLADPSGVEEFTSYLRKEYSHENIRFWLAVKELRHCSQSQVASKVNSIYEEFLTKGSPCEINIDSKTLETTLAELKTPSRFTFDVAAHHVYAVLLKKDCYPRFIRSDHYKNLLANAVHPPTKKRFFAFVGGGKKKISTAGPVLTTMAISKRRGSDRSLTGAPPEPPAIVPQQVVPLSTSQANLHEITVSRDGGVSPDRMQVPLSDTKQPSFERKSSEDEKIQPAEPEAGPSNSGDGEKKSKEAKIESKTEGKDTVNIPNPEEVTKSVDEAKVPVEPSVSNENSSSEILIIQSEGSSHVDDKGKEVSEAGKENKSDNKMQESEVNIEKEEEKSEPVNSKAVAASECKTPKKIEGEEEQQSEGRKSSKESKSRCRKDGRKMRILSEELRRGSEEHKMTDVRKHSLLHEKYRASVDEGGGSSSRKVPSQESTSSEVADATNKPTIAQNPADICPWEDEESCKTEETFVKKYATLGYL